MKCMCDEDVRIIPLNDIIMANGDGGVYLSKTKGTSYASLELVSTPISQ